MNALSLMGLGVWTPGVADVAGWLSGHLDDAVVRPAAKLLPASLRRRTSDLTRALADVVGQAVTPDRQRRAVQAVEQVRCEEAPLADPRGAPSMFHIPSFCVEHLCDPCAGESNDPSETLVHPQFL